MFIFILGSKPTFAVHRMPYEIARDSAGDAIKSQWIKDSARAPVDDHSLRLTDRGKRFVNPHVLSTLPGSSGKNMKHDAEKPGERMVEVSAHESARGPWRERFNLKHSDEGRCEETTSQAGTPPTSNFWDLSRRNCHPLTDSSRSSCWRTASKEPRMSRRFRAERYAPVSYEAPP